MWRILNGPGMRCCLGFSNRCRFRIRGRYNSPQQGQGRLASTADGHHIMSRTNSNISHITVIAALGFFSPSAFAYLDPSTGSMILSAIVGILATVGLALKTYWYKVKSFFTGNKATADQAVTSPETEVPVNSESD